VPQSDRPSFADRRIRSLDPRFFSLESPMPYVI